MFSNLLILLTKFFLKNSMDCQALEEAAQGKDEVSITGKVQPVVDVTHGLVVNVVVVDGWIW